MTCVVVIAILAIVDVDASSRLSINESTIGMELTLHYFIKRDSNYTKEIVSNFKCILTEIVNSAALTRAFW